MSHTDSFTAQLVKLVREMPDEAILDLVKNQLGALGAVARRPGPKAAKAARAVAAAAKGAGKDKGRTNGKKASAGRPRQTATSQDRQQLLDNVERIVKAGTGVSASDVAKSAAIPQTRAAAALKELKLARRIFQGGDRRFARYAGDAKSAELASQTARKNALGPIRPAVKKGARAKKRGAAPAAIANAK